MDGNPDIKTIRDSPIRVLHLVHTLTRGGIEYWLLDLFRTTDRNVLEMDVCCRGPNTGVQAPKFAALGAKIHLMPLGWNHAAFGRRLGRLLREGRYDLLHIHAGSFAGYPTVVGRRNGVAVATTFHSTNFPFETGALKFVLGWMRAVYTRRSFRTACTLGNAIVSCSRSTQDAVTRVSGIALDDRFHIVPHGSTKGPGRDPEARNRLRRELGIPHDAPVAIHVGIMKVPKNHAGLIRVADHIRRGLPNFRLLVAGDGPLRPHVEAQIRQSNLESTVNLLGLRDDVEQLLDAADLMIFPSHWEGLPVAVIEAQMKGLPVVGTDIGPMKEATVEGKTALLFPAEKEADMAQAVVQLFSDATRRLTMGRDATQFAEQHFSAQANAARHLDIYRQALAQSPAPSDATSRTTSVSRS
jgi:glycosyltransferase involved in cell wall biosynthesis